MNEREIKVLKRLLIKSGEAIMNYYGSVLAIAQKSSNADLLTAADKASDEILVNGIIENLGFNIRSEERDYIDNGSEYSVIIDPLDGTHNFAHQLPIFTSGIAVMKDDQPVFSAINCPVTHDLYWAKKDEGAFKNGKQIKVNTEANIEGGVVGFCLRYDVDKQKALEMYKEIYQQKIARIIDTWSPLYLSVLVAEGVIDALPIVEAEEYDFLPGKLLVKEAGGVSINFDHLKNDEFSDNRCVLSGNIQIAKDLSEIINQYF